MKRAASLLLLTSLTSISHAESVKFSLGSNGLNPANVVPSVTNSSGSGDKISAGICLDTTASTLKFNFGYGSAAGFTDLTGPAASVHIHGPASATESAGILLDLTPFLFPSIDPSKGGVVYGSLNVSSEQSSNLLAGLEYIDIHTATNPDGEIRAQLIPNLVSNTAPVLVCPGDATVECNGSPINLTAHVSDAEGDALQVIWSLNGSAVQTNSIAAGSTTNGVDAVFSAHFDLGTNVVGISVSDTAGNTTSCSSTIVVQDTTPPVISGCTVSPKVLWPPNHKLIPIDIKIRALDTCGSATWKIISVSSNEPVGSGKDDTQKPAQKGNGKGNDKGGNGSGNTAPDWVITSDHCVQLRAERSGKGTGRIYSITVQATDASGNTSAPKVLTVTVPHSQNGK